MRSEAIAMVLKRMSEDLVAGGLVRDGQFVAVELPVQSETDFRALAIVLGVEPQLNRDIGALRLFGRFGHLAVTSWRRAS